MNQEIKNWNDINVLEPEIGQAIVYEANLYPNKGIYLGENKVIINEKTEDVFEKWLPFQLSKNSWTQCSSYNQYVAIKEIEGETNFNITDFIDYEENEGKLSLSNDMKYTNTNGDWQGFNFVEYHIFVKAFKQLVKTA